LEETPRDKSAVWDRDSVYTLEFDPNGARGLCGRGNYCQELATHKKRLFRAKEGRKYYPIIKVAKDLSDAMKELHGERIALLLDGSLTLEETAKALALAEKLDTKLVAPLPAEDIATAPFKNNFTFDNIAEAAVNIIIGDVFTLSPTITKLIHDAKAKGRGHTTIVIDTVKSRTGWFGHPELIAPIGSATELLNAVIEALEKGRTDGFPFEDLDWAISAITKSEGKGNIIAAPGWHFADPFGVCNTAKKLAATTGFGFATFPLATGSKGIYRLLSDAGCDITGTYQKLHSGDIDALLAIDCDPVSALSTAKIPKIFAVTGQLPTECYEKITHFIPSTYLFEKTGSILGTEENIIKLNKKINGPGVPSAGEIIDMIYGSPAPIADGLYKTISDYKEPEEPLLDAPEPARGKIIAIGHGHVNHHYDGRYTRRTSFAKLYGQDDINSAIISANLAEELDIEGIGTVKLKNNNRSIELTAKVAGYLNDGIILLPMHYPPARALFDFGTNPLATPVTVEIEQK